jgi:hypothetical protein
MGSCTENQRFVAMVIPRITNWFIKALCLDYSDLRYIISAVYPPASVHWVIIIRTRKQRGERLMRVIANIPSFMVLTKAGYITAPNPMFKTDQKPLAFNWASTNIKWCLASVGLARPNHRWLKVCLWPLKSVVYVWGNLNRTKRTNQTLTKAY